jgi:hypothetical protein
MTIDVSSSPTPVIYCHHGTMPLNTATDDAVNQYDYPSTDDTNATSTSLPAPTHRQQQDIDFDLFTANAQVIPDNSTSTGMEQAVLNVDTSTDTTALHPNSHTNQKDQNVAAVHPPSSSQSLLRRTRMRNVRKYKHQ